LNKHDYYNLLYYQARRLKEPNNITTAANTAKEQKLAVVCANADLLRLIQTFSGLLRLAQLSSVIVTNDVPTQLRRPPYQHGTILVYITRRFIP
jgi:hypothetical protein